MKNFLFAANWKMYLSAHEENAFCTTYKDELLDLAQTSNSAVALFPSFVSLKTMQELFHKSAVSYGAQDCSDKNKGAYTGQIPAHSLAELGCSYTIVGHSERRVLHESDPILAQKVARLFEYRICPIICVGETQADYSAGQTMPVLTKQLSAFIDVLSKSEHPFCIAYEPVWAIGTGKTPTVSEIETAFNHITTVLGKHLPPQRYQLLYGGSITASNADQLYAIPNLKGFLIGGASTNFQEFKKIVVSRH